MYSHMTVQLYIVVITIPGVHELANLDLTKTDRLLTTSTRRDNVLTRLLTTSTRHDNVLTRLSIGCYNLVHCQQACNSLVTGLSQACHFCMGHGSFKSSGRKE